MTSVILGDQYMPQAFYSLSVLLKSIRIQSTAVEYWVDLLSHDIQWKPSDGTAEKE